MGPITLNWEFLDGYLEVMAFEVVLERDKAFSKGKQEENATVTQLKDWRAMGAVKGKHSLERGWGMRWSRDRGR